MRCNCSNLGFNVNCYVTLSLGGRITVCSLSVSLSVRLVGLACKAILFLDLRSSSAKSSPNFCRLRYLVHLPGPSHLFDVLFHCLHLRPVRKCPAAFHTHGVDQDYTFCIPSVVDTTCLSQTTFSHNIFRLFLPGLCTFSFVNLSLCLP